jgi:hypothetical protein
MKPIKQLVRLSLFLLTIAAFISCKKDLSTLDTNSIEGVTLDTTGNGILSVFQFDHLVVNPKIKTALKEADLTYEWKVNLIPGDTASQTIATTKNLDVEIISTPNDFAKYYRLYYAIKDNTTGLKYITTWNLNVKNSIGEGLVVAESTDGVNSDISHIMSPLVTPDVTAESIKHNIYSTINGALIPGLIKQMKYVPIYGVNNIIAITNNSIIKIKTLDYVFGGSNDDLFYGHTGDFKPESIDGVPFADIYMEKGKLTYTNLGASRKYGLSYEPPFQTSFPSNIAINKFDGPIVVNYYDEVGGFFAYIPSLTFGDKTLRKYEFKNGNVFNPANLQGKINLAAGVGIDQDFLHLLKDKTTGKVALYTFSSGTFDNDFNSVVGSPKAVIDMSNAPGINEATRFVLLNDQKVLYYATPTKIYAMLFSSSTPTFEERYTVASGEQITTLQIYQQSDYPFGDSYLPTNNKQLIMSTYKGTEGKVYILPMKSLGLGNIDLPNIKTYGGFGKISSITSQK